jgi:hypothetical protein
MDHVHIAPFLLGWRLTQIRNTRPTEWSIEQERPSVHDLDDAFESILLNLDLQRPPAFLLAFDRLEADLLVSARTMKRARTCLAFWQTNLPAHATLHLPASVFSGMGSSLTVLWVSVFTMTTAPRAVLAQGGRPPLSEPHQ